MTDTVKKNIVTLVDASMEDSPEINLKKTQFMRLFHCQSARQIRDIKMANKSF
jgi:hypothetical protein